MASFSAARHHLKKGAMPFAAHGGFRDVALSAERELVLAVPAGFSVKLLNF